MASAFNIGHSKEHSSPAGEKMTGFFKKLKQQKFLLAISLPFMIYVFIFAYVPLTGWIWSIFEYKAGKSFTAVPFIGFKYFAELFSSPGFWLALRNTLVLALMSTFLGTLASVIFAVLLNELRNGIYKRLIQTVSYLPHFVSWVVVVGIYINLLQLDGGIINNFLINLKLIDKPIPFLLKGELYWPLITFLGIWKETGWSAIIYLAAMTGINPELYESAYMDGAGRWKRIWYITLPGIKTTIIILLILSSGWILGAGFEQSLLLGNGANIDYSEVLGNYIYRYGLKLGRISFATAASVFQSITGFIFVLISNRISSKLSETKLF